MAPGDPLPSPPLAAAHSGVLFPTVPPNCGPVPPNCVPPRPLTEHARGKRLSAPYSVFPLYPPNSTPPLTEHERDEGLQAQRQTRDGRGLCQAAQQPLLRQGELVEARVVGRGRRAAARRRRRELRGTTAGTGHRHAHVAGRLLCDAACTTLERRLFGVRGVQSEAPTVASHCVQTKQATFPLLTLVFCSASCSNWSRYPNARNTATLRTRRMGAARHGPAPRCHQGSSLRWRAPALSTGFRKQGGLPAREQEARHASRRRNSLN